MPVCVITTYICIYECARLVWYAITNPAYHVITASQVQSVVICSDCHHCVTANSSGDLCLYNFRATEVIDVFKGHKSGVFDVMATKNQQLAISVSKVGSGLVLFIALNKRYNGFLWIISLFCLQKITFLQKCWVRLISLRFV